ncbi:shikimate kinase [Endozoicomonas sp.]|uniref:shikimate kinase n=1 Tax=Endozoicomonas sp. TaxID=1892382 RepID=UPI00383A25B4
MSGNTFVIMGVSGSGKSTVGESISRAISAKFIDGDDLHPRANIEKMAGGHPLNDDDRQP